MGAASLLAILAAGFVLHRVVWEQPTEELAAYSDTARYFHPNWVYLHDALREGALPLWNPYQMAGLPFLATHIAGPLYPTNLLLLAALPAERALVVHGGLHLFLAALLTWALGRRIGLSNVAAVGAALAYAFSAEQLRALYNPAYLATHAWLPGVLWATHGLVKDERPRWCVVLGAALALSFLGGHAQGMVFSAQLGAAYGFALWAFGPPARRRGRVLVLAAGAGLVATGLAAVQLLPTLDLLRSVPRVDEGLSFEEAVGHFATPPQLLGGLLGRGGAPFACTSLFLPLAISGWLARPLRRQWIFFAVAGVATALLALGPLTPAYRLYFALPGGDLFRFPARVAIVYVFCTSVMVGIGLDGLRSLAARSRALRGPRAAWVALLAVVALGADLHSGTGLRYALPVHGGEMRGGVDLLVERFGGRPEAGRVFVENFGRYFSSRTPYLAGSMNRIFVVPTYEPMIPADYGAWFGQDRLWRGFASGLPHRGPRPFFLRTANPESIPARHLRRLLDLMSVRFYVADRALAGRRLPELKRFTGGRPATVGNHSVFVRPAAVPRAYTVHETLTAADAEQARGVALLPRFEPRRQAVVEERVAGVAPATGPDEVSIRSYAPERVEIDVRCASACLLVLTDLHFPGWRATLDGAPVDTLRVNGLFRGVVVPSGDHEVVHEYVSVPYRAGVAVTGTTVGLLLVGGVVSRRRDSAG